MRTLLATLLLLTACSTTPPLIDLKASDTPENYQTDYIECQALVDQNHSVVEETLWDTTKGVVLGATAAFIMYKAGVGADVPMGWAIGSGAAVGGITSGGFGAYEEVQTKRGLTIKCLEGRGYKVIE